MGLGAPKKRSKLSSDPNNTAWTKNTGTFGHKILSKQGWKPGNYLGAENATHSEHYTAANASHIRVMLREDNLGLGAKIGGANAETFGLSMFSGLLGRLNGKDDGLLQKQEEARRDVELRMYQAGKYGTMNFVSGGLLVGDKMEAPKSTPIEDIKPQVFAVKEESRKRKSGDDAAADDEESRKKRKALRAAEDEKSSKKEKKKNKPRKSISALPDSSASEEKVDEAEVKSSFTSSSEDEGTTKERRKDKRKSKSHTKSSKAQDGNDDEKARMKADKRARKEERRKRKEEKRRRRAEKGSGTDESPAIPTPATQTPSGTSTPTPTFLGGRQAVRHRYIMQKRMAAGNAQALKEIFMLQPQAAS